MDDEDKVAGVAALGLLETLIAVLAEKGLLAQDEVDEMFLDAADAFEKAVEEGGRPENVTVAELLKRIQTGNDGIRWK